MRFIRDQVIAGAAKLRADYDAAITTAHHGSRGTNLEAYVERFLRQYIPRRFEVAGGHVIAPDSQPSSELDLIVYDSWSCPPLEASDARKRSIPLEAAYATIEVKATVRRDDIRETVAATERVKSMWGGYLCVECGQPRRLRRPIASALFGFNLDGSADTFTANLESDCADVHPQQRLDAAYVLGSGVSAPDCHLGVLPFTGQPTDRPSWRFLSEEGADGWHALLWLCTDLFEFLTYESRRRPPFSMDRYGC